MIAKINYGYQGLREILIIIIIIIIIINVHLPQTLVTIVDFGYHIKAIFHVQCIKGIPPTPEDQIYKCQ
jgi:hypothetical protein